MNRRKTTLGVNKVICRSGNYKKEPTETKRMNTTKEFIVGLIIALAIVILMTAITHTAK